MSRRIILPVTAPVIKLQIAAKVIKSREIPLFWTKYKQYYIIKQSQTIHWDYLNWLTLAWCLLPWN